MSAIISNLLATAELPVVKLLNLRRDKTSELIDELDSHLNQPDEVRLIIELLLKKDANHVLDLLDKRLQEAYEAQASARRAYEEHRKDSSMGVEALLTERVALIAHIRRFADWYAAYEMYVGTIVG